MQGFKSFPDKISLDFDKGITAVVGPNGSGKSNIGDAMRWVMGEQSSKTLRGGKMEDVIFSGTQLRKSVGFAQVTLTIDNSDKALNVDNDIVRVSRKLYRNGDSEYIINGENVRLKDIVELFMDTGLGRDGYSIIGQGRIADIVSSKSTDRREIFEEAAGISKFRYKKEEAERKLTAAEDNISRISDILSELQSRLGPLKTQSEKARKFIVLEEEKRGLEISLWVIKLDKCQQEINDTSEKLSLIKSQYTSLEKEVEDIDEQIEEAFANSAQCADRIEALKADIHRTELDNTQSLSKIAVAENDIEHLNDTIKQIEEQISAYENDADYLANMLASHNKELVGLEKKLAENKAEQTKTEQSFNELSDSADSFDKELEKKNNELNDLYLEKSSLSFKIESAGNSVNDTQLRVQNLKQELDEADKNEAAAASELKQKRASLREAEEKLGEHKNKLSGFELLLKNKAGKLEASNADLRNSENELIQITQRLNILKDLENSMEGFAHSVKSVLKASKQGRLSGIIGSVAGLISIDKKYNIAVETALGGAMQHIVTDDENGAKRAIKFLKETNAGRATFLPVTSVKGSRLDVKGLDSEDGFVAVGCDIVKCDARLEGVIKSLLGRVCIAENIDLASNIAKKYGYKFKICTLDGQVINAGGSFTGGSASRTTGILSRKNEISELSSKREKIENDLEGLRTSAAQLRQECATLTAQSDGEKETIRTLENENIRLGMEIDRLNEIRKGYDTQAENAEAELEKCTSLLKGFKAEADEAAAKLTDVNKLIGSREKAIESSKSRQQDLKSQREALTEKLSSVRIESMEIAKDIELVKSNIEQTKQLIDKAQSDSSDSVTRIGELKTQIEDKKNEITNIKLRIENSADIIKGYEREITSLSLKKGSYSDNGEKLRSTQRVKLSEKETLQGQLSRLEETVKNETNEFDRIVASLFDNYELTRTKASELADMNIDVIDANKRLSELKNKIKALGNVNVASIEEYKEVGERYEKMNAQLEDVNNSKHQLEELIDDLTERMKSIFTESFDKINTNFKAIFTELFGGGRAELVLADTENVLECGIDIRVAPPGKVIKNLVSLSGGEQAFVAIAIYFAILKLRPSPFCLLDEIEAALDDVNVAKYAQYLHKFTDRTQFITITHRRGTMEEADILYGVTMQSGISKLLRMTPDEAYTMQTDE